MMVKLDDSGAPPRGAQQADRAAEPGLRVHLPTVALSLLLRSWWLLLGGALGAAAGIVAAKSLGTHQFRAETVMMHKAPPPPANGASRGPVYAPPSLNTALDMVKLRGNLAEVRRRLKLDTKLSALGAAIDVELQRKTTLVVVEVTWDDAVMAAKIANTTREVFVAHQLEIRKRELVPRLADLNTRRARIAAELAEAEGKLKAFTNEHKVVDISQELRSYLEELSSADALYEQARLQQTTVDLQLKNLDATLVDLRKRVAAEQNAASSQMEALSNVNIRLNRLRQSISKDKRTKELSAELAQRQIELERARKLHEIGALSDARLEKAKLAHERVAIQLNDSPQVKEWKAEMARLDESVVPSGGKAATPSSALMTDVLRKTFDLQLTQVANQQRVDHLKLVRDRLQTKLDKLPSLQRSYAELARGVSSRELQLADLVDRIGRVQRVAESQTTGFTLISEAEPPIRPRKSNRKLIVIGVAGGGLLLGALLMLVGAALDLELRSAPELALWAEPTLVSLPQVSDPPLVASEGPLLERYRRLAHLLLEQQGQRVGAPGKVLLVASAEAAEGRTTVAANLAAGLGRLDRRVLLIDADLRHAGQPRGGPALASLIDAGPGGMAWGLGEYLAFAAEIDGVIDATKLPGVSCVPLIGPPAHADQLGSRRLEELLDHARAHYDLVLIDGPPLLDSVDAELLAARVDGVLWVARACVARRGRVAAAIARLREIGAPLIGSVLNGARGVYGRLG